jgi:hypothetical protein
MKRITIYFLVLALIGTAAVVSTWALTGRHYYTKFRVVETVEQEVDANDPFAGTGFYDEDDSGQTKTVVRDEFHLGLLPVPQGIFDKHMVSVVSIAVPLWGLAAVAAWVTRRRNRIQEA